MGRKQEGTSPLGHFTPMPLRLLLRVVSLCASGAGKPERLISGFFLIWGLTFRVENLGTLVVRQHITNLYCASSSFRYLL